ncbi:hypothetical protein A3G67_03025 [Candidatus Roizmanbacteria bacterium RIFCSPLOWO2_12_FULL_40_12]|uniref:dTDP-4-dehydrorhamnose 3,5-epimerase n=1 Tax=Candidatus Roizmanbacteria bacterium RIFCSPLOWO2_01_FULL_40_42 TaxID=1802066 RepID=A0A1F7J5A8_9BACT|nr:MAG: hypothetical protein A2779_02660 [Candidatus Roizmanbacteria bacterium RIFCSPHIGHO2_01_FULL_40_98]OGK28246.1 MAG: hypothetical protein A3C31_00025 [Candidatus Roizmanbacteria bacterium RIFCSPHIGHO2_02_FULL_40_53]OGK30482.1 MAG: hypothetical protein A2W49_02710 [Candidatus Roizmanbacteria bacterium RIFCSPHIGHO2_12_41_18]OGK36896.1 MAG: hypothetical protein A3E69_00285 [Candidatus Roizmanbacteria bacterium RIFCSPHIGHO2_12_FULL_40_130]OGK50802.1 MAG: hypothetical protein A3B50_00795 [Candi
MKILEVKKLAFPEIQVIRFRRFMDHRGYYTEVFNKTEFKQNPEIAAFKKGGIAQSNEGFSKNGVIRGLHLQWDPFQAKLIRTLQGHMIDLFLDIRKGSPTYGKIGAYDMSSDPTLDIGEWIWIPVGFAHGVVFLEDTSLEYMCDTEWSPGNEASISPFASDIDWSLVSPSLLSKVENIKNNSLLIKDKDKDGFTLEQWGKSVNSNEFKYEQPS